MAHGATERIEAKRRENAAHKPREQLVFEVVENSSLGSYNYTKIDKAIPANAFGPLNSYRNNNMAYGFDKTYASNELVFQKSAITGKYKITSDQELLSVDDYKIPLRLLVTQVKNSQGQILKVYVKHVLPEFLDFNDQALDKYRANLLTDSVRRILGKWETFNAESYRKVMTEKYINDPGYYNDNSRAFTNPDRPDNSSIVPSATIPYVLLQGLGAGLHPLPPLIRQKGFGEHTIMESSAHNSRYASWISNSKIYSVACQLEAERKQNNFSLSTAALDAMFENPGNLLRKPTNTDIDSNEPGSLVNFTAYKNFIMSKYVTNGGNMNRSNYMGPDDPASPSDFVDAQLRHMYMHTNLSKHFLYEESLSDMFAPLTGDQQSRTNIKMQSEKALRSIGCLTSWFNQKRADSFWGRTSKKGEIFINDRDSQAYNSAYFLEVANLLPQDQFRTQDSNLNCGPSLFYNDYRQNVYSLTANMQNQNLGNRLHSYDYSQQEGSTADIIRRNIDSHKAHEWAGSPQPGSTPEHYALSGLNPSNCYVRFIKTIEPFEILNYFYNAGSQVAEQFDFNVVLPRSISPGSPSLTQYSVFKLEGIDLARLNMFYAQSEIKYSPLQEISNPRGYDSIIKTDLEDYSSHSAQNVRAYNQVLDSIKTRYNQALESLGIMTLIREVTNSYVSELEGDETIISDIVTDSKIKYGLRINLNSTDKSGGSSATHALNAALKTMWTDMSSVSEEERMGATKIIESDAENTPRDFYTLPIASFEKDITKLICNIPANTDQLRFLLNKEDQYMKNMLTNTQAYKDFYEFIIPSKTMSTALTIHSGMMLASYGEMPIVLRSAKAALANAFYSINQLDPLGDDTGDFTSAQFLSTYGTLGPNGGQDVDCLTFPDLGQWWEMIKEMIKQMIRYFPSIVLRGIADGIDPMYKEMKRHYLACEIGDLTNKSWQTAAKKSPTEHGLYGSVSGKKKYVPIVPGFPVDLIAGGIDLLKGDADRLGMSLDRLVGYIFMGPVPLIQGNYAFKIPCLDINQSGMNNWDKYKLGGSGRYGHPITPISLLALQTLQLPADMDLKNNICQNIANPVICVDEEE